MAKLVRVYDPDETERRINLILKEAVCPGLLEFMSELPYGMDTPLIRGVFYQWFKKHSEEGTLEEALHEVLSGPAGLISLGSQRAREQHNAKLRKRTPAKAVARQNAPRPQATPVMPHTSGPTEPKPDLPAPVELDQQIESRHLASEAPSPPPVVHASPAPALSEDDQHPLTVAQVNVAPGEQLPDADQVALLHSMGNIFP
ncbi:hypothetical protein K5D56_21640 [Pseudomonas cichorii]|nr:hypothetical protein [Pseudomonas cichorii]MBX8557071.1 hypothetical protein [Pseudomonas cichorii]MBX8591972.1 hypothetical protein [Pseudomonas cichorii]